MSSFTRRLTLIFALLIAANLAAWAWAIGLARGHDLLLGTALLAWGFGLRHAVDADHIAAIDNVTRKLMQDGQRPIGIGLFFSLGHSSIVILASAAIALTAQALTGEFAGMRQIGGVIGTLVSAGFLFAIALVNLVVLGGIVAAFSQARRGGAIAEADLDRLLARRGLMGRALRPLFHLITRSWHMFPLGLLFGLGFDTATEIGVLGLSASQAGNGLAIWSILVFPALFTAGMALIDTADGVLMLGAYGWAFVDPLRKLYYNMTITGVSVLIAALIGGLETLDLIRDQFDLTGGIWSGIAALNQNFGLLGYVSIGLFALAWLGSYILWRVGGYGRAAAAS